MHDIRIKTYEIFYVYAILEFDIDCLNGAVLIDMDANDTATLQVTFTRVSGTGVTNTIVDATTMYTFFSGHLVC